MPIIPIRPSDQDCAAIHRHVSWPSGPHALGPKSAASVLDDEGVTVPDEEAVTERRGPVALTVGQANQNRGNWLGGRGITVPRAGEIEIGGQADAVSHGNHDVSPHREAEYVCILRRRVRRDQRQAQERHLHEASPPIRVAQPP